MLKTVVQMVGMLADMELTPNLGLTVSINKNEKITSQNLKHMRISK